MLRTAAYAFLVFLGVKLFTWRKNLKKLPPGPPKLPVIGNLHNMPPGLDWVAFAEFGKQYDSDIIHLGALGTSIIVLNSYEAAQDLLDQRSAIYSSRVTSVMTHELSGFNTLFALVEYGDMWKTCRRIFVKHFGSNTNINRPREVFYIRRFLTQLLAEPERFRHQLSCLLSALSISMTYGVKPAADRDPYVDLAEAAAAGVQRVISNTYLVDFIPALKYLPAWFPGTTFKMIGQESTQRLLDVRNTLFRAGKTAMETTECTTSFLSEALQNITDSDTKLKEAEEQEDLIKDVANMVYLAAFDTALSSLGTFFLAMTCHPEAQLKAQEELDKVLKGKLPEHDDIDSLPYLNALVMEVLRWKPAVPPGVPHSVITDDVYKGYQIPKNSIVIANAWAMLHNPVDYPSPFDFKPERFLKNGQIDESVRNPMDIAFGFGRRKCPGQHIALSTIKMTVASVLSMFNIRKKVGANGQVIEPSQEYTSNLVSQPLEFPCVIEPRSSRAEQTIDAWALAEGDNAP